MTDPSTTIPSSLTDDQLWTLMQPLHQSRVASRRQGGQTLTYVEAYDIKAMLIRVFGFGGFNVEVIESRIIDVRTGFTHPDHTYTGGDKAGQHKTPQVLALSTIRLTIFGIGPDGRDAVYTESSIGSNNSNDIGDAADNAIKSAASDALKRCAIYLGTQFGLGLYNNGSRDEIVRHLLQPEQKEQWEALQERARAAVTPDPATQARLQQATAAAAQVQPSPMDGVAVEQTGEQA